MKASALEADGPGTFNESVKKTEKIEEKIKELKDGEINVLNYFTIPEDINEYRFANLPDSITLSNGVKVSLEKLGVHRTNIQFHELLFLFGWNAETAENKKLELNQNYMKYGINTSKIASDNGVLDVFSGVVTLLASLVEFLSFYITGFTVFIYSVASTNAISDLIYTIGKFVNDSMFDWTNPKGFGIGLLVLLVLTAGVYRLLNQSEAEKEKFFSGVGALRYIIRLVVLFCVVWFTITQAPKIIRFVDKKVDQFQIDILNQKQEGMTSNILIKSKLFHVMQVLPYKMRTFGIGEEISIQDLEASLLYTQELTNKGLIEKIASGTVDLIGNAIEFFSFGAFQYGGNAPTIKDKMNVVSGLTAALSTFFFSLIMLIVKLCILVVTSIISLIQIFFKILRDVSYLFVFFSMIKLCFSQQPKYFRWWGTRLQWSFLYMVINLLCTLFLLMILEVITLLMTTNFFLTILLLLLMILVSIFTVKIMGKEGIKAMFKNFMSSLKSEGTVLNGLKNIVANSIQLVGEDSPIQAVKENFFNKQKTANKEEQTEKEYERGKQMLLQKNTANNHFTDRKKQQKPMEEKLENLDQKELERRKVAIDEALNQRKKKEEEVTSTNKEEQENEVTVANATVEFAEGEKQQEPGEESQQNIVMDSQFKDIPKQKEENQALPEEEKQEATNDNPVDKAINPNVSATDTSVNKKKSSKQVDRKGQRKQKQYQNLQIGIDLIDKGINDYRKQHRNYKNDDTYKGLVDVKRYVNKQDRLTYKELNNLRKIVRESKRNK